MFELLSDPTVWVAFGTLTVLEIVLGIDNIVFISVLVSRLPKEQADRARQLGLALAWIGRYRLLRVLSGSIGLKAVGVTAGGHGCSGKAIILLAGGLFLIYKATHEMHAAIAAPPEERLPRQAGVAV